MVLNSVRQYLLVLQESRSDKTTPSVASSKRLGSLTGDNSVSLVWTEMSVQLVSNHCTHGGVWSVVKGLGVWQTMTG
jgi:hypothetical protein